MPLDTIFVVHHPHTDVGFTNDQPIFWELQYRFIDDALRLIDRYAVDPPDSRFRWTVETTCGLDAWLKTASGQDVDRLIAADKAGLLEGMAMQTNSTPLLDRAQLIESLRPVQRLRRDYGLDIHHAMNCDVNGQNWTLADLLLDASIGSFSVVVNHHFVEPPHPRPNVFLWQAPSGRTLPTLNGWQYSKANDFGLGDESDERFTEWLPRIGAYLAEISYPLPFLLLQGFHPFGDDGTAWDAFAEFARRWNDSGRGPRIVTATPRMFWARVKEHLTALETLRGDWTDYWNFDCISPARETAIARPTRSRLHRADAIFAMLNNFTAEDAENAENKGVSAASALSAVKWSRQTHQLYRDPAWHALNLYGEHTWGADTTSNEPQLEDSLAMDNHKKHLAHTARSLGLLLERDALADFAHFIPRRDPTDLLIFNPLPWERAISGPIPKNVLIPRGLGDDATSSRHFLGRMAQPTDFWTGHAQTDFHGGMGWLLRPTPVPAFGYAVVGWDALASMVEAEESDEAVIENGRFRITFDTQKGGITSLFDRQLNHEWADASAGHPLHGFVHEEVADHDAPEPRKLLCTVNRIADTATERGWHPDLAGEPQRAGPGAPAQSLSPALCHGRRTDPRPRADRANLPARAPARCRRRDRVPVRVADGLDQPSRSDLSAVPVQSPRRAGALRRRRRARAPAPGSARRLVLRLLHRAGLGRFQQRRARRDDRRARKPDGAVGLLSLRPGPAGCDVGTRHATRLSDQQLLGDELPRRAARRGDGTLCCPAVRRGV